MFSFDFYVQIPYIPRTSDEQTFLYISTFWPFERKSLFVAVFEITSVLLEGQVVLGPTGHFGPNNWPVGSDVPFGPLPFVPCLAISLFGMEVISSGEKIGLFWKLPSPYDPTDPTRDCKTYMSDKFTPIACEVCIHEVLEYMDQP